MTVDLNARASWRRLLARWGGVALLCVAFLILLPHLGSGSELVRLRNALALGPDLGAPPEWRGGAAPLDYLREEVGPDPFFIDVARRLDLTSQSDDWERALTIARHLLGSAPVLHGGPIKKDLRATYLHIVQRGDGYCGDFVRAFMALAHATGMVVRPWAFSLDGFGGHGHIWVEVWNTTRQRWQLLDVYQNYYYVDGNDEPLSAAELRAALQSSSPTLQLRPIAPQVPAGWAVEAKAWDYLRRGVSEWYMPWGANVFTVDAAAPVRLFSGLSRVAEGLGAFVAGVEPKVRLLATLQNAPQREAMRRLRLQLFAAAALAAVGTMWLLLASLAPRRCARERSGARVEQMAGWPRICLVGPLPPPSGGMANQCEQLARLLRSEGATVELVRTNAPYWPAWTGRVRYLRAGLRLIPYLASLWRQVGRCDVLHVFANSGWAWHLLVAPALYVARLRGVPAIVNYRGGQAAEFLRTAPARVHQALRQAAQCVTPSVFLQEVFARHGIAAEVVPNIVDLSRFRPGAARDFGEAPHLVVTRNLEPIYDIPTALRAFSLVRECLRAATLTVAGSGPERSALERLASELGIASAVYFTGRVDNAQIAQLYHSADLMLNPSTVDNMPISILEALASGVPVVSTDAGGIPRMVCDGFTALLVPVGDHRAMAEAAIRVLSEPALTMRLREQGLAEAARYDWHSVRPQWQRAYWAACGLASPPSVLESPS